MNIGRDLESLRGSAPETTRTGALLGVGLMSGYSLYESPVGEVAVAFNIHGVAAVELAEQDLETRLEQRLGQAVVAAEPPPNWGDGINRAIELGRPGGLPLDFRRLTAFQRDVLQLTATIPSGEVRPYGWLAAQVGNPGAVRAVGSTMARNPVPLIVPCHRVVRSDGLIGNYSLGGPDRKWQLLTHEGAEPEKLELLASRGIRYVGSDTTKIFCHPSCRAARRITTAHRVEFRTSGNAHDAGYRECLVCRP